MCPEVEDALVQNHFHADYLASLNQQKELASSTLAEARSRYLNGLSSYLPVLQALQGLTDRAHIPLGSSKRVVLSNIAVQGVGRHRFGTLENPHLPKRRGRGEPMIGRQPA